MDTQETADKLNSLIKLDVDAVSAYNQALDQIDVPDVEAQMTRYRDDHERHITALSEIVEKLGEKPAERSKDFKGFLIEGFTMLRGAGGTQAALQAMETNEKLTNKKYGEAMNWDVSAEVHDVITMNYQDEREHLTYIERQLGHEIDVEQYHGT